MALRFKRPSLKLPPASQWLPAVVLVICLSMLGMIAVTLLTVGADPESGPSALPTSTAAQGYQGLRRILMAQGHDTQTNRFEDADGSKASAVRGDIEFITLNNDGGTFAYGNGLSPVFRPRPTPPVPVRRSSTSASSASSEASQSASADEQSASAEASVTPSPVQAQTQRMVADDGDGLAPDRHRSDHVLKNPLGRVVIVVAPKWDSGTTPTNPRWGANARLYNPHTLKYALAFLSPMSTVPSPSAGSHDDEDGEGSASASASSAAPEPKAPPGKALFDDGDTLLTYDKPAYEVRYSDVKGRVVLHGAPDQALFQGPLDVGRISDLQSISGPNLKPVLLGPNGEVLISRVIVTQGRPQPKVPIYLISDPDLLNNQILADPKKVVAALRIIDTLAPPSRKPASIVFNLTFNQLAFDHDLLHALSRPPFLAIPLSLLLLALALVWAAFSRFGPPHLEAEGAALGRGVKVLADNAARLMAIAVKEAKLGPAYAQVIRDEVLRLRGYRQLNRDESLDDLADRIGLLYGATDTYSDLRAKAGNILTVHQLIGLARRLHAWKTEIGQTDIGKTETDRANS